MPTDSFINSFTDDELKTLFYKTDQTLVKKRKNLPDKDDEGIFKDANLKGELARYANNLTFEEKKRVVKRHEDTWQPYFVEEFGSDAPRHPWKILKSAREDEGGQKSLGLDSRYCLRVVKEFYAERWRDLAA